MKKYVPFFAAALSGFFLYISFPPEGESAAAWFALAPLLAALRSASPRKGFFLGLTSGLVFWLLSISWLWKLTENGGPAFLVVLGHSGLSAYCSLYIAFFAAVMAAVYARLAIIRQHAEAARKDPDDDDNDEDEDDAEDDKPAEKSEAPADAGSPSCAAKRLTFASFIFSHPVRIDIISMFIAAAVWTAAEFVRSVLFSGFAWNHLGVSQAGSVAIIQIASIGGVYAVSALLVIVNAAVANVIVRIWQTALRKPSPKHHWDLMIALIAVFFSLRWGMQEINRLERSTYYDAPFKVMPVQANTPSIFEKDDDSYSESLKRLYEHTSRAAAFKPDLVVWPESAVTCSRPPLKPIENDFCAGTAFKTGIPLLTGAVETGLDNEGKQYISNASWLFNPDDTVGGVYWKQHLVPFGEYIPGDCIIPALEKLSPIGYSCEAGKRPEVFSIQVKPDDDGEPRDPVAISPLICFEDTVPALSRKAVKAGARVLVNQSNDAWFFGSAEAEQHQAQAVFRAIENRIPLIRCSNRGLSSAVDAAGRVSEAAMYLEDIGEMRMEDGKLIITHAADPLLYRPSSVKPRTSDTPLADYTVYGDWIFAWPCLLVTVIIVFLLRTTARKNARV